MRTKSLIAASLMAGSCAANAASVTYDFTGTVTSATGIYSAASSTVSGTYTIDIGAGIPSQSILPVSLTNTWLSDSHGGGSFGIPAPSSLVFSSTLTSGGVNYSNTTPSSIGSESYVEGYTGNFVASDVENATAANSIGSQFTLAGSSVFDATGLPVFSNASSNSGALVSNLATSPTSGIQLGSLTYTVTSLTVAPVPLPTAAWLMLSGLGGLGALMRKKPAASS